ncbi:DEKNAAC101610 [Brettanomyces naardenensis]|uniref:DEKNAAC101610 n=1 Tax=Brettanomyces naardenensis TaxID=13370 RepID=A0A448YI94_BRENA|nr:DEKNAAC101610 [Brettanomyces naardenensis]
MSLQNPPKVLFFDVFGTVVNWRSSIHRALAQGLDAALHDPERDLSPELRARAASLTEHDLHSFASEWRQSYKEFTRGYKPAEHGGQFVSVDQHHLDSLLGLLHKWNLDGLYTEAEIKKLSLSWHYLVPWSDSSEGLSLLNQRFETSTLSNGNASLLADLCKFGPLPFKHVTSAEEFGAYKPSPVVYDSAARKLGFKPSECALVAAHLNDLQAAKARGFQAIYVERPQEEDWTAEQVATAKQNGSVDLWVGLEEDGFRTVAKRSGIQTSGSKARD